MTAKQFFSIFFNNTAHSVHPSLNSLLDIIAKSTSESGYELWLRQTLIPLYAWALPEHSSELKDLTISTNKLYTICKLSSFAENHPPALKHCPVCMHHDVKKFGTAYWHRQHQIFGVTSCNHHQVHLNTISHPRLSFINHHISQYKKKNIALCNRYDFDFACFCSKTLDYICKSSPEIASQHSSELKESFIQYLSSKNSASIFKALHMITINLDHSCKDLLPTSENNENYWKTLLYNSSPQSPSQHLILLYCIGQFKSNYN